MVNAFRTLLVVWALLVLASWLIWSIAHTLRLRAAHVFGQRFERAEKPLPYWTAVAAQCVLAALCVAGAFEAIRRA